MLNRRLIRVKVFKLLFGNETYKENTLALYNALNGTSYTNVDDVNIYTIEDVIYIDMKNNGIHICPPLETFYLL